MIYSCIIVTLSHYITLISHVVYKRTETFHASDIHNVEYNRTAGTE